MIEYDRYFSQNATNIWGYDRDTNGNHGIQVEYHCPIDWITWGSNEILMGITWDRHMNWNMCQHQLGL